MFEISQPDVFSLLVWLSVSMILFAIILMMRMD